jgi:uncharacterized protein (UPF0276 family)
MDPKIQSRSDRRSIPAQAGIGLRSPHHEEILAQRPAVGWLEAHSENFFSAGGTHIDRLERLRANYPLSLHGVGLSLGSTDPINRIHLNNLKRIVARFEPELVSEHLSWSSVEGRFANDLLPMPYTEEAIRLISGRIDQVQNELGRPVLVENVSSYVQFDCSQLPESEFVASVVAESSCGLLLDLNNIYVSGCNHHFDPYEYLDAMPAEAIREIHLAGHTRVPFGAGEILIDTHSAHVCDEVWALYAAAIQRLGNIPTLIEWDSELPSVAVLAAEAQRADRVRLLALRLSGEHRVA